MAFQFFVRVGQWLWMFLFPQLQNIYVNNLLVFSLRLRRYVVAIIYGSERHLMPVSTIQCKSISEQEIRTFFGDVSNDRLCVLINEAINSIRRVEENSLQQWLKNTCLNLYIDNTCYKFKSGNGRKLIVVNYENENPVTEFLGFPEMD